MNRAIKYRIYPTPEQKILFAKTFGSCRKVWNLMLADKKTCYEETGSFGRQTPAMYKSEYPFLREADSLALANVQLNLQAAMKGCFDKNRKKRTGFPKFKSKHRSKASYTTNFTNGNIAVGDDFIKLPKAGRVKAVIHREADPSWKLKSVTVSMERDGGYYASVLYEYKVIPAAPVNNEVIGLDYKSDGLYMDSCGHSPGSQKYYRESQEKLARAQRKLRHKTIGSNNYRRQQLKVSRIHRKIADRRKDFLHKESLRIANSYGVVCVEDLDMKAVGNKGFGNGRATMDNSWGMFVSMLEYKLRDRGGRLVKVDKWYPSSQTCSNCGHKQSMPLDIRTYTCPECGMVMDRDLNAAVNIRNEGLRLLMAA